MSSQILPLPQSGGAGADVAANALTPQVVIERFKKAMERRSYWESHWRTSLPSVIVRDLVVITNNLGDEMTRQCIEEELAQGLGLFADTDIVYWSIMNEESRDDVARLTLNDKILIRTLYDERLQIGMTREQAMPIVRQIIPELVAAVRERGEAALYQ